MNNYQPLGVVVFGLSIALAMGLKVLAVPETLRLWNPDWVLLILIYWLLTTPNRVGVFSAWSIGLLTDVLTGRLLGQYALIYALLSYICLKFYRRVRRFPPIQQGLFVSGCLLLDLLLDVSIQNIRDPAHFQWLFFLPVISGTVIWLVAGLILYRH